VKTKVHSDLRNCVQIMTLVDDQWMEFARFWYGPDRFLESKDAALRWADLLLCTLTLSNNQ
jgi:hypothetical protein